MGGSPTYVERDGQLLTLWMAYVITLLDADLFRLFGVHVIVTSAIRTYARQEQIFRERYVTAGDISGRRVYDTRVWKGIRWYRISPAGTVAVPGTSNHEIQGTKAAVDIRDTGSDAGITVRNSVRGRWFREWCRRFGLLIASGDGFGEGWHFDVPDIFRIPPSTSGSTNGGTSPSKPKEIKVKTYSNQDKDARAGGRTVTPGGGFYLHDKAGLATSQAKNVVGGIGPYSITPHVYAAGTPGDVLELKLIWQDTKARPIANSPHYVERLVIDKDGQIRASREFKRAVADGYAVYVRLDAPSTNKGALTVTLLDCDAYLFTVA